MDAVVENFVIYAENVSYFYVLCIFITFIAVFATWKIDESSKYRHIHERSLRPISTVELQESQSSEATLEDALEESDLVDVKKYPTLEKKILLENMSKTLNFSELEKEKQIEKQQLASIFELIKQDQTKFQIESMQELEEQMKLYRE